MLSCEGTGAACAGALPSHVFSSFFLSSSPLLVLPFVLGRAWQWADLTRTEGDYEQDASGECFFGFVGAADTVQLKLFPKLRVLVRVSVEGEFEVVARCSGRQPSDLGAGRHG